MEIAIIANGDLPRKEYPRYLILSADVVVCCDGVAPRYERAFGLLPDLVVGDLDSLSPRVRAHYGDRIVHFEEQDYNDLTKALRVVLSRYCGFTFNEDGTLASAAYCDARIHIMAASGRREDHTFGNYALLMEYERMFELAAHGINVEMVSDFTSAFAMTDTGSFDCGAGRAVSILTPDNSLKISSRGLQWPTDDVVFDNWWKATLNRSTDDTVTLTFSHPSLALIFLS